jgi:hypothetical protein
VGGEVNHEWEERRGTVDKLLEARESRSVPVGTVP